MVGPLILGAVALGSGIAGAVFGGDSPTEQTTYQNQTSIQETNTQSFSSTTTLTGGDVVYNPVINLGSGSVSNVPTFKKEQEFSSEQSSDLTSKPSFSASQSAEQSSGTDLTKIALIGGLVAGAIIIFGD